MKIGKKISLLLSMTLLFVTITSIPVFASYFVNDVVVSSLNIRTGGGLNYPIIGQEPYDADILDNWSDIYTSADGYRWNRVYYPVSSDGQYKSSRVGWAAVTVVSTGEKWTKTCSNVKTTKSMYFYLSPNLTNPSSTHYYTSGEYTSKSASNSYLSYEPGYLNAWRLNDLFADGNGNCYGNGWYLNAGPG